MITFLVLFALAILVLIMVVTLKEMGPGAWSFTLLMVLGIPLFAILVVIYSFS